MPALHRALRHCLLPLLAATATTTGAIAADSPTLPELRLTQAFVQPAGPRGLEPTSALRAADGRHVRVQGFMVAQEQPQPGQFLLTPRPVRLSEHADGDADDLPPATLLVLLPPAWQQRIAPHVEQPVALTGVLHYGRHEAADGRVVWLRLALQDEDLPAAPNAAPAPASAPASAHP